METVNNMAAQAAKAVWGDSSQQKEPISGAQGDVPRGQPYDAGNLETSEQHKLEKASESEENYTTTSSPFPKQVVTHDGRGHPSMPGGFPSSNTEAALRHDPNEEPKVHTAAAAEMDLGSQISPGTTGSSVQQSQPTKDETSLPIRGTDGRSSANDTVTHNVFSSAQHSRDTKTDELGRQSATTSGFAAVADKESPSTTQHNNSATGSDADPSRPGHDKSELDKDVSSSGGNFGTATILSQGPISHPSEARAVGNIIPSASHLAQSSSDSTQQSRSTASHFSGATIVDQDANKGSSERNVAAGNVGLPSQLSGSSSDPIKDSGSSAGPFGETNDIEKDSNEKSRCVQAVGASIPSTSQPSRLSDDTTKDSDSSAAHFGKTTVHSQHSTTQSTSTCPADTDIIPLAQRSGDREHVHPADEGEQASQERNESNVSPRDDLTEDAREGAAIDTDTPRDSTQHSDVDYTSTGKISRTTTGDQTTARRSDNKPPTDAAATKPSEEGRKDVPDESSKGIAGGETNVTGQGPKPVAELAKEHGGDAGNLDESTGRAEDDATAGSEEKEHQSKGTGEQWVKTTGFAADGGDFDAAKPGAGKEADRLMEEKGMRGGDGNLHDGASESNGDKDKPSVGERIKEKLHIH